MATARKSVVAEGDISLRINRAEAGALQTVLARVGGDPEDTPRKHLDDIAEALTPFVGGALEVHGKVAGSFGIAGRIIFAPDQAKADKLHEDSVKLESGDVSPIMDMFIEGILNELLGSSD